ncbi:hypothetical protein ABZ465_30805 [Streptomyces griseoincarnatus]
MVDRPVRLLLHGGRQLGPTRGDQRSSVGGHFRVLAPGVCNDSGRLVQGHRPLVVERHGDSVAVDRDRVLPEDPGFAGAVEAHDGLKRFRVIATRFDELATRCKAELHLGALIF